jgi:hypothetical protein
MLFFLNQLPLQINIEYYFGFSYIIHKCCRCSIYLVTKLLGKKKNNAYIPWVKLRVLRPQNPNWTIVSKNNCIQIVIVCY